MNTEPGDKVRIKTGAHEGVRGVVEKVKRQKILVRINEPEKLVEIMPSEVTNFSLAARKAWERMPHRRVGRPKGSFTTDRVSVTLRIDRELWTRFKDAETANLIDDRTERINAWIAEKLEELEK